MPSLPIRELQAESIAYVVARHFGLDSSTAPNYLALHGLKTEHIKAHMQSISAARSIIDAIDPAQNDTAKLSEESA